MKLWNYDNFVINMNEGLIHTYSIKTSIRILTNKISSFGIKNFRISNYEERTIVIVIESLFFNIDLDVLINIINMLGYFPSIFNFYDKNETFIDSIKYENINNEKKYNKFIKEFKEKLEKSYNFEIQIESKFNQIVNKPDKVFHLTRIENLDKILKIGLVSKSNSKIAYHPSRIYFGFEADVVKNLSFQFGKGEYVLLEIDLIKINIKLYNDPDFYENGCYTIDNIPPKCIKIIDKIIV